VGTSTTGRLAFARNSRADTGEFAILIAGKGNQGAADAGVPAAWGVGAGTAAAGAVASELDADAGLDVGDGEAAGTAPFSNSR
jgi:hypothetical protein